MKISFIIPAFNEEGSLAACLRSVLNECGNSFYQTEVIVVNNASTDKTREIVLSFPNVKLVDEPRKGLSFARQAGFLASSGDLIANIDADSLLTVGWINKVVKKFQNRQKLIALSGPVIYYDMPLGANILIRLYYYFAYLIYLFNRFVFRSGSLLQGGNFVVRRSALEKIGGYNTAFKFYGEDTDIARRLRPLGPVVFNFYMPVYTSGRRLKQEGFIKMGWKYPINYFWTVIFKRPFHNTHIDIRTSGFEGRIETTVEKLNRVIGAFQFGTLFAFLIALILAAYVGVELAKLGTPTIAKAETSHSYMVRKWGPEFLEMSHHMHRWGFDRHDL